LSIDRIDTKETETDSKLSREIFDFSSAQQPIWQGIVENVRTIIQQTKGYIRIPSLAPLA